MAGWPLVADLDAATRLVPRSLRRHAVMILAAIARPAPLVVLEGRDGAATPCPFDAIRLQLRVAAARALRKVIILFNGNTYY